MRLPWAVCRQPGCGRRHMSSATCSAGDSATVCHPQRAELQAAPRILDTRANLLASHTGVLRALTVRHRDCCWTCSMYHEIVGMGGSVDTLRRCRRVSTLADSSAHTAAHYRITSGHLARPSRCCGSLWRLSGRCPCVQSVPMQGCAPPRLAALPAAYRPQADRPPAAYRNSRGLTDASLRPESSALVRQTLSRTRAPIESSTNPYRLPFAASLQTSSPQPPSAAQEG